MHDLEAALPALRAGRTVIEGRSLHSTAVYQSLIMKLDDGALLLAEQILDSASRWRPLPDMQRITPYRGHLLDDRRVGCFSAQ